MSRGRLLVQLALNTSDNPVDTSTKGGVFNGVDQLVPAVSKTSPDYSILGSEPCVNDENLPLQEDATLTALDGVDTYNKVPSPSLSTTDAYNEECYQDDPFQGSDSDSEYLSSEDTNDENNTELEDASDQEEDRLEQNKDDGRRRKRKSKGQGDHLQWKRAKNAEARVRGHSYTGFRKNNLGKYEQTAHKEERKLRPRCKGHKQALKGPQQKFQCAKVSDEERQRIFDHFWKMRTWEAKKVYISSVVLHSVPKHRRRETVEGESRKQIGFRYYLKVTNEQEAVQYYVCKAMFLSTLDVGERMVRDWVLNKSLSPSKPRVVAAEQSQVPECAGNVAKFLNNLPKVESHYCRASSRKLYLEPTWNSYRHVHREFLEYCKRENKRPCSWRLFLQQFKSMNLDIYAPRKDQCNTCIGFKKGNVSQADYDSHKRRKDLARMEKEQDKAKVTSTDNDNSDCVYTVDLQAVLLSPYSQATAMYYKQKLKVHNHTFFNLKNKEVSCFLWHEGNGGLESDVFVSNLTRFIKSEIEKHQPTLITIWSDGCGYQNRNVKMSNGLLELAIQKSITIEQKYLEVGHTQMEVDSVHSVIERMLRRKREVSVPADYMNIIKSARQKPSIYQVISVQYTDFLKYDKGMYASIRPGNKKGDPCVTDICALQYLPEGVIKYKLQFSDAWVELPRRPFRNNTFSHTPLYASPRQIEDTKFIHLQELKSVIEPDYHEFYNNLRHSCPLNEECCHIIKPK